MSAYGLNSLGILKKIDRDHLQVLLGWGKEGRMCFKSLLAGKVISLFRVWNENAVPIK